ncbi:MAG: DinB family protein [Pirellulaceae bacterium]
MTERDRLDMAVRQLEFARQYTLSLIEDIEPAEWFQMPGGSVTHVAWQVAHLAMAEYGLCLYRARGRRTEDLQLMSSDFRKRFSRGTVPNPDPTSNPTPDEIRTVLQAVHAQALLEMADYPDELLNEPVDMPYSVFPTKLGAILFCSAHEMLHAGQIGLLRRLLGKSPVR